MKKILLLFAILSAMTVSAQTFNAGGNKEAVAYSKYLAGSNYTSYFTTYDFLNSKGLTQKSETPEGYEPFYITTFARHGSRWLGSAKQYDAPTKVLQHADSLGMLTEKGKTLLKELRELRSKYCPDNMFGQLTPKGAEQHRAIARRMCAAFPEIFNKKGQFYAQSSTVKRCVESMDAEIQIVDSVTGLHIKKVSGLKGMQHRLTGHYKTKELEALRKNSYSYYGQEISSLTPYKRLCGEIFKNTSWTNEKAMREFTRGLFDVIVSIQNLNCPMNLWKYFTEEEVVNLAEINDRLWYRMHGPAVATGKQQPMEAKYTMQDILAGIDSVANRRNWHGGNLRFGHDLTLAPLACLMELGTTGDALEEAQIGTLNTIWRLQEITPMAGNIQLVFYRPKKGEGDVLIKALLNEVEVSLPATAVTGKYYRWTEVRSIWAK